MSTHINIREPNDHVLWAALRGQALTDLRRLHRVLGSVIVSITEPVERTMSPDMAAMVDHIDNQRASDGRGDLSIRG